MTTYTAIPDANLDPDSPARSIDALALRDNPLAMAEGATGAPRIQVEGFQAGHLLASTLYTAEASATGSVFQGGDGGGAYGAANFKKRINGAGVFRVSLQHRIQVSGTAYVRVMKNDVQQAEFSTASTSFVDVVYDVSVAWGDVVHLEFKSTTNTSNFTNVTYTADNEFWTS